MRETPSKVAPVTEVQMLGPNHVINQRGSTLVSHCCHNRSRLHGAELHQTPVVLLSNVLPALFCRFVTFIVLFLPLLLFSSYSEKDTKWQLLQSNISSYTSRHFSNKSHAGTYPRKRHHIVFFQCIFFKLKTRFISVSLLNKLKMFERKQKGDLCATQNANFVIIIQRQIS